MTLANDHMSQKQQRAVEPIAIIGMACRWPSAEGTSTDIETPSALWNFLQARQDAYSDFPAHRIKLESWYHPTVNRPGSFYTRGGCFLKSDPRTFDPTFFGINQQETASVDPAQRKFLEVVYEAFESAGLPLDKLSGSKTGCFVGNFNYDHQLMQYRDTEYPEPYGISGGGIALLSNRVNYVFNLRGPSLTLDTACSSSMYALHLACASIDSGECSAAVVGGSNLILTPECQVFSSSLGAVSKTSRCHTFDAAADGYARADGIGALCIKSLKQAIADNDPIRAVIRGTAINANGRTAGITHPDPYGQESAIRRAYERAGSLNPADTSYFEMHGTGTPVGDPLEVEAVSRVFAELKTPEDPLLIGSIKTNLGHCEPASGIAGIMKAVLALENGSIPPIRGLNKLNPNVDLKGGRLQIVQKPTSWPVDRVRRASVNSFGYGGANAHTVLEATDELAPGCGGIRVRTYTNKNPSHGGSSTKGALGHQAEDNRSHMTNGHTNGLTNCHAHEETPNGFEKLSTNGDAVAKLPNGATHSHANGHYSNGEARNHSDYRQWPFLIPFSSHNERTLKSNIGAIRLQAMNYDVFDLAYTLSCRRSTFTTRSFAIAKEGSMTEDLDPAKLSTFRATTSQQPTIGFVFTGQGAQWPKMGFELMDQFPVYLFSIRLMDEVLASLGHASSSTWSIEQYLSDPPILSNIHQAAISQPLVTAIQVALVDLLASWGIRPAVVAGHSSGEIAAAYACGRVSAAEAIIIAYARGRAVSGSVSEGAMLAVGAGAESVAKYLAKHESVTIACHNSPESVTLSGDKIDIMALENVLKAEGMFVRILQTDGKAYHSAHMQPLGARYEKELDQMLSEYRTKGIHLKVGNGVAGFVSSVHGTSYQKHSFDVKYWRTNLESPVRFYQAITTMVADTPPDVLIEIGPHSALQGPIRQIMKSLPKINFPEYMASLVRNMDDRECMLRTAGVLFAKGCKIDLREVNAVRKLDLATGEIADSKKGRVIVDLPKYQWQYENLNFIENRWTKEWRLRSHPRHDLLGSRSPGGNQNEPEWRNIIRQKDLPWLEDHKIGPDVVFPTTAYLSMIMEAATQTLEIKGVPSSKIASYTIKNVSLRKALIIPDGRGVEVLVNFRSVDLLNGAGLDLAWDFAVTSVSSANDSDLFTQHVRGAICLKTDYPVADQSGVPKPSSARKPISPSRWYDTFSRVGLNYGPTFQGLTEIYVYEGTETAESHVNMQATKVLMPYESRHILHSTAIDSTLQLAILAAYRGRSSDCKTSLLPISIGSLRIQTPIDAGNTPYKARAKSYGNNATGLTSYLSLVDGDGWQVMAASNVVFTSLEQSALTVSRDEMLPFTRMAWKPKLDLLTEVDLHEMFPRQYHDVDDTESPLLEQLALHQIVQFHALYPELYAQGSNIGFLKRYMDWMVKKVEMARQDKIPGGVKCCGLSTLERDDNIKSLTVSLMEHHAPETRLMCHMYRSLPAIYKGEMTGIQAAVQDHLLDDTYKYMTLYHRGNSALKELVLLLSYQNPALNILEVGGGTASATREVVPALRGGTAYRGYGLYTFTDITTSFLAGAQDTFKDYKGMKYATFDMQNDPSEQGFGSGYDLVIASNVIHATTDIRKTLSNVRRLLKPGGKLILFEIVQPRLSWVMILGTFSDFWNGDSDPQFPRVEGPFLTRKMWDSVLPHAGFSGVDVFLDHFSENKEAAIIMASAIEASPSIRPMLPSKALSIIYRGSPSRFVKSFVADLQEKGCSVDLVSLTATCLQYPHAIFMAEVDGPLFINITAEEWQGFKHLISAASSSLWVTRGSLLNCTNPEYAMISGIACALHTETRSSRFVIVDVDLDESITNQRIFKNLIQLEDKAANFTLNDDFEYRCKKGIVHVSRLSDHGTPNADANSKAYTQSSVDDIPWAEIETAPLRLAVDKPSALDTLHFTRTDGAITPLKADHIEIQVDSGAMSKKSTDALLYGEPSNLNDGGLTGVVTKVGSRVARLRPGDRVFGITFKSSVNLVQEKAEFFRTTGVLEPQGLASIPGIFCNAIYGLVHLGKVMKGENVLVHNATSGIGQAACQILKIYGGEVYATVVSEQEKAHLLSLGPYIDRKRIFVSSNVNYSATIRQATEGRGIDLVFSIPQAGQVEELWDCMAPCGRYVRLGSSYNANIEPIEAEKIKNNVIFASLDLEVIAKTRPTIISSLMGTVKELLSRHAIKPVHTMTISISQIRDTLANMVKIDGNNLVTISYRGSQGSVPYRCPRFNVEFEPTASYLLVECLGGLGQSFASWMVSRGARRLTFLSRAGESGPGTQAFVSKLQDLDADIHIVQGDVTSMADVQEAVNQCIGPIKGVIQAPLTLNDAFFSDMTLEQFNATMRPRVLGTMNLHQALLQAPLNFFVMWSSWTKMFGSASQSNYMAASSFMDAFAGYRRSLGLPGTSLALGQILDVGIVSHIPEYQTNLLKMGLYGNSEDDFLQYCEAAISESAKDLPQTDATFSGGHLLAGVEPSGLKDNDKRYPIADMPWYSDPRFSHLLAAVDRLAPDASQSGVLVADDDEKDTLVDRIHKRVARFLFVPKEDVNVFQPISTYGLDSLVAAEVRNWLFKTFEVNISSLNLLHPTMTIDKLANDVAASAETKSISEE